LLLSAAGFIPAGIVTKNLERAGDFFLLLTKV